MCLTLNKRMVSAVFQKYHNRQKTQTVIIYVNISLTIIVSVTESESKAYKNPLNDCVMVNEVTILQKAENEEYLLFGSS